MSAEDKIAEVIGDALTSSTGYDPDWLAVEVVAAIRAMTPTEQADLLNGVVSDPNAVRTVRVVGPWREVTP